MNILVDTPTVIMNIETHCILFRTVCFVRVHVTMITGVVSLSILLAQWSGPCTDHCLDRKRAHNEIHNMQKPSEPLPSQVFQVVAKSKGLAKGTFCF